MTAQILPFPGLVDPASFPVVVTDVDEPGQPRERMRLPDYQHENLQLLLVFALGVGRTLHVTDEQTGASFTVAPDWTITPA